MAKVSLARKKELNEPDAFIETSGHVARFIQEHKEKVIGIIVAVVMIFVGIGGYLAYSDYYNKKAFTALARDFAWYNATAAQNQKPPLSEIKKRSDEFFSKYSGTTAGMIARSGYAGIYFAEGDYKSALSLYEQLVKDLSSDLSLKNSALCGLAYTYEALGQTEKAVNAFKEITESTSSVKKDEAFFHLGLLYETTGDREKSRNAFKTIVETFPESVYIEIAKEKATG